MLCLLVILAVGLSIFIPFEHRFPRDSAAFYLALLSTCFILILTKFGYLIYSIRKTAQLTEMFLKDGFIRHDTHPKARTFIKTIDGEEITIEIVRDGIVILTRRRTEYSSNFLEMYRFAEHYNALVHPSEQMDDNQNIET